MRCWETGTSWTGRDTTDRWFAVTSSNGVEANVSASDVDRQATVPACNRDLVVQATRWGTDHFGTATTRQAERANTGSGSYWSGYCWGFVEGAYHFNGRELPRGTACQVYESYHSRGQIHTGGTPPRGALVYWASSTSAGHAALGLGNDTVIASQGFGGQGLPISTYGLSYASGYLGWARAGSSRRLGARRPLGGSQVAPTVRAVRRCAALPGGARARGATGGRVAPGADPTSRPSRAPLRRRARVLHEPLRSLPPRRPDAWPLPLGRQRRAGGPALDRSLHVVPDWVPSSTPREPPFLYPNVRAHVPRPAPCAASVTPMCPRSADKDSRWPRRSTSLSSSASAGVSP